MEEPTDKDELIDFLRKRVATLEEQLQGFKEEKPPIKDEPVSASSPADTLDHTPIAGQDFFADIFARIGKETNANNHHLLLSPKAGTMTIASHMINGRIKAQIHQKCEDLGISVTVRNGDYILQRENSKTEEGGNPALVFNKMFPEFSQFVLGKVKFALGDIRGMGQGPTTLTVVGTQDGVQRNRRFLQEPSSYVATTDDPLNPITVKEYAEMRREGGIGDGSEAHRA